MLQLLNKNLSKGVDALYTNEFEKDSQIYADQTIKSQPIDINQLFMFEEIEQFGIQEISFEDAWQGEKLKAFKPQDYVHAIRYSEIVPGTLRATAYGQTFDRISVQPNWISGNLGIVKEEVHIIEAEHRILFLGRPVDQDEAKSVLGTFFKQEYYENIGPLFHVEHGLKGTPLNPINTWALVLLDANIHSDTLAQIQKIIDSADFKHLYQKTLERLYAKKKNARATL